MPVPARTPQQALSGQVGATPNATLAKLATKRLVVKGVKGRKGRKR